MPTTIFEDAEPSMMDTAVGASNSLQLGIDTLAIIIGIFALIIAVRLINKLGGRINQALRYFIAGIICNAAAIVWSLFFGHVYVIGGAYFDVHQNFMTFGMIFFILSTLKFSKLVENV